MRFIILRFSRLPDIALYNLNLMLCFDSEILQIRSFGYEYMYKSSTVEIRLLRPMPAIKCVTDHSQSRVPLIWVLNSEGRISVKYTYVPFRKYLFKDIKVWLARVLVVSLRVSSFATYTFSYLVDSLPSNIIMFGTTWNII